MRASKPCREILGARSFFGTHVGVIHEHLHLAMHGYGSSDSDLEISPPGMGEDSIICGIGWKNPDTIASDVYII